MFDYGDNQIREDIKRYLRAGCRELCYTPGYLAETEKVIEHDKEILSGLLNDGNNRVLFIDIGKFIDKENTTKKTRLFKDEYLYEEARKLCSEEAEEYLWKLGIRCEDEKGVFYGDELGKIGKLGRGGYCKAFYPDNYKRNDMVIYYGANEITPGAMLFIFYHECGHALQKRFIFENKDKDFEMLWAFKDNVIKGDFGCELSREYQRISHYLRYLKESHSDTFASAVVLLKCGSEEDFEKAGKFVMGMARNKIATGLGRKEKAIYNFYPMAFSLIRHLKMTGSEGRKKFLDKNGDIDFLKVNRYAAEIVRKKAYSKAEFRTYSEFDGSRKAADLKVETDSKRWVAEYYEAKDAGFDALSDIEKLFFDLKNENGKKGVYALLEKRGEEMADLREIFLKYNSVAPVEPATFQQRHGGGR